MVSVSNSVPLTFCVNSNLSFLGNCANYRKTQDEYVLVVMCLDGLVLDLGLILA
jgi:hypothetical protein